VLDIHQAAPRGAGAALSAKVVRQWRHVCSAAPAAIGEQMHVQCGFGHTHHLRPARVVEIQADAVDSRDFRDGSPYPGPYGALCDSSDFMKRYENRLF
jgi:hypothetical protein